MKKQNPNTYTRCIDDARKLYFLHDSDIDILIKLVDYQIHIYNATTGRWFNTGYMVTPQVNQTRSIMRAWSNYLKCIYGIDNPEIVISMEMME